MRTKISLLTIVMFLFVLLSGCVVRTNRGHGYHKRGRACPVGWHRNNKGGCYKKGPPPGQVKTRDHR